MLFKVSTLRMVLLRRYHFVRSTTPLVFWRVSLTVTCLLTNIILMCHTMKWVTTARRPGPVAGVIRMAQLQLHNSTLWAGHRRSCFHCTAISRCCQRLMLEECSCAVGSPLDVCHCVPLLMTLTLLQYFVNTSLSSANLMRQFSSSPSHAGF